MISEQVLFPVVFQYRIELSWLLSIRKVMAVSCGLLHFNTTAGIASCSAEICLQKVHGPTSLRHVEVVHSQKRIARYKTSCLWVALTSKLDGVFINYLQRIFQKQQNLSTVCQLKGNRPYSMPFSKSLCKAPMHSIVMGTNFNILGTLSDSEHTQKQHAMPQPRSSIQST